MADKDEGDLKKLLANIPWPALLIPLAVALLAVAAVVIIAIKS